MKSSSREGRSDQIGRVSLFFGVAGVLCLPIGVGFIAALVAVGTGIASLAMTPNAQKHSRSGIAGLVLGVAVLALPLVAGMVFGLAWRAGGGRF